MRRTLAFQSLVLALPVALAACGRIGVDAIAPDGSVMEPDASPDAPPDAPPPPTLACGTPVTFALNGSTDGLFATATPTGYAMFTRDVEGNVLGFTYDFDGTGLLKAGVRRKAIGSEATNVLIPVAMGSDLLLAMPYGLDQSTGTDLFWLDAQLTARTANPTRYDRIAPAGGLVRNAQGVAALLTQTIAPDDMTDELTEARLVTAAGNESAVPAAIANATNSDFPSLAPHAKGFIATWFAPRVPQGIKAVHLDNTLAVTSTEPTLISSDLDASQVRAAYLAAADRYLFVWFRKTDTGADEVVMTMRNGDLSAIENFPPEILLSGTDRAFEPVVVAGNDDFLVAWETVREDGATFDVAAARVSKKGEVFRPTIARTGGETIAWDLVVKDGQPALVWLEDPASLRFDAVCLPGA